MTFHTTVSRVLLVLGSTALIAVPAEQAAAAPPAHSSPTRSAQDMPSVTRTVSCSAGGMTGEAVLSLASDGTRWRTTVERYKISANGRSKGNVNPYVWGQNFVGQVTLDERVSSRDAMVQDGQWHDLGLQLNRSSLPWAAMSQASSTGVEFVFDKSGSDPRCSAGISSSSPRRTVQHLATTPGRIDKLHPLASCYVLSDGITCSIAESRTATSSVNLTGAVTPTGESLKWITGNINASWTASRTVDVRCTSPVMRKGELFVAYPTGVDTQFRVQVDAFGVHIDGPGTAFEVANGIACEVS
ncbi:hypothetical protein EDF27_2108 [Curtobacterium sp. PhB136]|nr:hypothetical protein EDF27_2108 [Curtobacterium sp. PhB136]